MLFLLSDGQQNRGYSWTGSSQSSKACRYLYTRSHTITATMGELEQLSGVNEAAALNADSEDIVNLLRKPVQC